jgi:large subunit ribosomal protein L9
MQVVLLEPISKLGKAGDIVDVKNGFARNYLIPRGAALRASKDNIASFEERKKDIEAANNAKKNDAEALAKKIEGTKITIIRQAAADGRLFGSVTVREISENLKEQGFDIESKAIDLLNPIKAVGANDVRINLHAEVQATIIVNVARSESEAEQQLVRELEEDILAREQARIDSIERTIKAAEEAAARAEAAAAAKLAKEKGESVEGAEVAAVDTAEVAVGEAKAE